jgi:hypothetical protein
MLSRAQQAVYRPIVDAAWKAHCLRIGLDPSNAQVHETWYRDCLWSLARVRSSADADDEQFRLLVDGFRTVAAGAASDIATPSGFSPKQTFHYRRLALAAYRAAAGRSDVPLQPIGDWLAGHMSELGIDPAGVDRVHAFEAVMARLAAIAGDSFWSSRTAEAEERRYRHLIRRELSDLSSHLGRLLTWDYVVGLWRQMRQSSVSLPPIEDAPAEMLRPVLQALRTHARRVARRELTPA